MAVVSSTGSPPKKHLDDLDARNVSWKLAIKMDEEKNPSNVGIWQEDCLVNLCPSMSILHKAGPVAPAHSFPNQYLSSFSNDIDMEETLHVAAMS